MATNRRLTCAISGSFKFKAEIDALHETFGDTGVDVIAPSKGWVYRSPHLIVRQNDVRPLPNERGMTGLQIENVFLDDVRRADFAYLYNKGGYIGDMVSLELGVVSAISKPLYMLEPLGGVFAQDGRLDLEVSLSEYATILPPEAVAEHFRETYVE